MPALFNRHRHDRRPNPIPGPAPHPRARALHGPDGRPGRVAGRDGRRAGAGAPRRIGRVRTAPASRTVRAGRPPAGHLAAACSGGRPRASETMIRNPVTMPARTAPTSAGHPGRSRSVADVAAAMYSCTRASTAGRRTYTAVIRCRNLGPDLARYWHEMRKPRPEPGLTCGDIGEVFTFSADLAEEDLIWNSPTG